MVIGKMMERGLTVFVCVAGILFVSYGMVRNDNAIFIIGIMCVIGGYLLIRKNLKASIRKRNRDDDLS